MPARIYRPACRWESPDCFHREWLMPCRSRRTGALRFRRCFDQRGVASRRSSTGSVGRGAQIPLSTRRSSGGSTRPAATSRCEFCYRCNGRSPASAAFFNAGDRYGEKITTALPRRAAAYPVAGKRFSTSERVDLVMPKNVENIVIGLLC
ncbi:hypothetical protein KCP78_25600 [Salmonella enterica subsp. enterica]|nr:hypothetical protein KCP78_25600 [Salmonella enterica subsp. enterica]